MKKSQRGFIDMNRQKPRKENVNRKSFQHFDKAYETRKAVWQLLDDKVPFESSLPY
jgi:hypothetical protein